MKCVRIYQIGISFLLIFLIISCAEKKTAEQVTKQEIRETVFDRVVHIEPKLIMDIPPTPRWCDQLNLKIQRINVGDCELYVEEEGEGFPLVLINGGPGGTHHYFHPWFSQAKDWARIIYYDQRGTGLSDYEPGKDGYSVDQAVNDLDAIRKALNIKKWVVLGYSYGGFLAQYYTVRYPENVSGLALLGSSPGMWVKKKPSRQREFLSEEERTKIQEIGEEFRRLRREEKFPREKGVQLMLYNNFKNGDWKRQHYYKPSPERFAQIALYEWIHDQNFNSLLNSSKANIDLTGAFEKCPVPTLLIEGRWDLTWNTDKSKIMLSNHPGAKLVMFEKSGHGVYDEEPERFFKVLRDFVEKIHDISDSELESYKSFISAWDQKRISTPSYALKAFGWDRGSNEKLAGKYTRDWLESTISSLQLFEFLKIGLALYDVRNYSEALYIFERMKRVAEDQENKEHTALALLWQGHMLDLMGEHDKAVLRYKMAADMNIDETWMHSQFGMKYRISPYAKERMSSPFKRIENRQIF